MSSTGRNPQRRGVFATLARRGGASVHSVGDPLNLRKMETFQEFLPFAKEMLSQRRGSGMVKVYLVGSVLALFGVVIGLVETVCQPFSAQEGSLDEELPQLAAPEQRLPRPEKRRRRRAEVAALEGNATQTKPSAAVQRRNSANRLHAS
ncbi:G0/G1 switch protein 2-like [Arapaima gigas]